MEMTDWMNKNRHTGRRTYRPPLQIFPAGMSTIDKMKAIAPWLVVFCVIIVGVFKATDSWSMRILSFLPFVVAPLVKALFGGNSNDSDNED